jgi:hypothetical protein
MHVTIFLLPLTHKLMVLIDNHWLEIKNWEFNKRLSIYLYQSKPCLRSRFPLLFDKNMLANEISTICDSTSIQLG